MATANLPPGAYAVEDHNGLDPFVASPHDAHRQRYSAFDNSQFSLYLNGSPAQAKKALQAHLAETTRRLQETSHLGNALVQQRKELEEKLNEVDKQEADTDIGPELRSRLAELEKEFNEVGRETARAFLPKSRVPSGESDATAGASVYTSEAQHSPSKVSVPSRKQRNQQPSRINDIALATEISTSLLAQLKDLQAVLLEKDEALKAANLDRSQLEIEVEGLSQRMRTLDESESRLKDVNWNLETQVREFEAQSKAAADKEHRLNHNLNLAKSEKSALERDFEELKQQYAKLNDDQSFRYKQHETELSGLRRNVSMGESERSALQRKVEELATQNQELAKAVAYRLRSDEQASGEETSPDEGVDEGNTITPEHSPPASPTKATPRHGQLESETLKHSLHHAHRMIQQLKNNIHREKTEKMELKRMLQDARDELETNRNALNGPGSASKRRKNDKDIFKKPARPDRLGALRTGSEEIVVDDDEWEEQDGVPATPSRRPKQVDVVPGAFPGGFSSAAETSANEGFETANETSDAAFETANERGGTTTETDAFQTGAETLDGDSSDDLTETEGGPSMGTVRYRPSSQSMSEHRDSYESTASTSGDEWDTKEVQTPVQPQHPRYRLKVRQGYRRSTPRGAQDIFPDTPPAVKDSPASFASHSNNTTPLQGQSLLAELGALSAGESEDGSVADGTPSRSSLLSPESSPEALRKPSRSPLQTFQLPRPVMVDSGVMTEPWEPTTIPAPIQSIEKSSIWSQDTQPKAALPPSLHISSVATQDTTPEAVPKPSLHLANLSYQGTEPRSAPQPSLQRSTLSSQGTEPQSAPRPSFQRSVLSSQDTVPRSIPLPSLQMSPFFRQETEPLVPTPHALNMSSVSSQGTIPQSVPRPSFALSSFSQDTIPQSVPQPTFAMSSHSTQGTDPTSPVVERQAPLSLNVSSVTRQATEPKDSHSTSALATVPLVAAGLSTQMTEPKETASRNIQSQEVPRHAELGMASLSSQATPVAFTRATPQLSMLSSQSTDPVTISRAAAQLSTLSSLSTDPVEVSRPAAQLSTVHSQITEPVETPRPGPPRFSSVSSQVTEPPIEPHVAPQPANGFSDVTVFQDSQPESPTLPPFLPSPSRPSTARRVPLPTLAFSHITSRETEPSIPSRPTTAHRTVPLPFPVSAPSDKITFRDASTEPLRPSSRDERVPLGVIASNIVQKDRGLSDGRSSPAKQTRTPMADGGTQTMVSSEQIDRLLLARSSQRHSGTIATADVEKAISPPASPSRWNSNDANRASRRPGSSSSARSRVEMPPLPPDHKEVIAAASLKSSSLPPPAAPGSMAPPLMPASAYKKRPQTPTIKTTAAASTPKTGGTTPRVLGRPPSQSRSGAASPATRRSSMSSFSSELDQRFNIAGMASFGQSGLDGKVDPRMIQAITQTMFGEFMWKYTRKAGGGGISGTRHRRYFWIHPFTRTLYWSKEGPNRGPNQMNAKSVAIESVHSVADNNPLPPGLHERSIVITTPGRTVQFTATTSQRHDTWMNALLYLLQKTDESADDQKSEAADEIQNEFNGGLRSSSRQTGRSRVSYATLTSRRTASPAHTQYPTLRHVLEASATYEEPNSATTNLGHDLVSPAARSDGFGMEDVRACCNGKHHLHELPHQHSTRSRQKTSSRPSIIGSMSSRSHSRAESYGAS
ncbi:hypothetical protein CC80DRAFT_401626 [Byssothecium circinans]|uniref:PH domain-containing protein n=1 Tax=Byssothecium circinans TaxID=147558 RepID=A0A6A5UCD3_9PLEO|nr:hypothetical protein CC80DRAFT_401626 [Byssothecium circinans]